jgi:hypothetical protein
MPVYKQFKSFGLCLVVAKSPSAHDPLGVIQYAVFLQIGTWQKSWNMGRAIENPTPVI